MLAWLVSIGKSLILRIAGFFALWCLLLYAFPMRPDYSLDNVPHALLPVSLLYEKNLDFNEFVQGERKLAESHLPPQEQEMYYLAVTPEKKIVSAYPVLSGVSITPLYGLISLLEPDLLLARDFNDQLILDSAYISATLITMGTAIVLFLLTKERFRSEKLAWIGVLLFLFCTEVISTSSRFITQHTVAIFWTTLSLYFFYRKKYTHTLIFSIASTLTRPTTLLLTLPFALAIFIKKPFSKQLQSLLSTIQKNKITSGILLAASLLIIFFALAALPAVLQVFAPHYTLERFSGNFIEGLFGITISLSRGLFIFSSFFIFALYQMIRFPKKYIPHLIACISYLCLTAKWDMWWGGASHGYRMVMDIIPLLIIPTLDFLSQFRAQHVLLKITFVVAVLLSAILQSWFGAHMYSCGYNETPSIDILSDRKTKEKLWSPQSEIYFCLTKLLPAEVNK